MGEIRELVSIDDIMSSIGTNKQFSAGEGSLPSHVPVVGGQKLTTTMDDE